MTTRSRNKLTYALSLAVVLALLLVPLAFADSIGVDGDILTPGEGNSQFVLCPGVGGSVTVRVTLKYNGSTHFSNGDVDIAASVVSAASSFIDANSGKITLSGWDTNNETASVDLNLSIGSNWSAGTYKVTYTATQTGSAYSISSDNNVNISEKTSGCTVSNRPPLDAANNASVTVDEGSVALNAGTWSDPDGDDVTLTASVGSVTKNADETWDWSFATTDGPDESQTVTIIANNGKGGEAQTTFALVVRNVAPSVSASFGGSPVACGADNGGLDVTFTDPGADTHTAVVNLGDGSADEDLGSVTSPFTVNHTYSAAGIYNATVTVTDSDGAPGSDNTNSVTVNFTTSGILQPVNPGPPTSVFKYKSTIPVKIQVQDCDGSYPDYLAPQISVLRISGTTPTGVEEIYSTSAADTGTTMRFTGNPDYQYIYNLATKSLADSSATYRITITIPYTGQKVEAFIGLKP